MPNIEKRNRFISALNRLGIPASEVNQDFNLYGSYIDSFGLLRLVALAEEIEGKQFSPSLITDLYSQEQLSLSRIFQVVGW